MQCLEDDAGLSSSLGAMNLKCLEDDAGLSSSLRQGRSCYVELEESPHEWSGSTGGITVIKGGLELDREEKRRLLKKLEKKAAALRYTPEDLRPHVGYLWDISITKPVKRNGYLSYLENVEWKKLEKIGSGKGGVVSEAIDHATSSNFLVKIPWDRSDPVEGLALWVLSNKRYIPNLYGIVIEKTTEDCKWNVYLFCEKVEGKPILDFIGEHWAAWNTSELIDFCDNLRMGLRDIIEDLHSSGFCHNDLQINENILIGKYGRLITILDFGDATDKWTNRESDCKIDCLFLKELERRLDKFINQKKKEDKKVEERKAKEKSQPPEIFRPPSFNGASDNDGDNADWSMAKNESNLSTANGNAVGAHGDNASVLTEEDCERAMAAPSPPNKSPASSSPAEFVTERADESDKENAIPHNFMPESDAERAKESDTENADESDKENADQDADEFDQENADREQQRVNKYGSQNRSKSGRKALKQLNIV